MHVEQAWLTVVAEHNCRRRGMSLQMTADIAPDRLEFAHSEQCTWIQKGYDSKDGKVGTEVPEIIGRNRGAVNWNIT